MAKNKKVFINIYYGYFLLEEDGSMTFIKRDAVIKIAHTITSRCYDTEQEALSFIGKDVDSYEYIKTVEIEISEEYEVKFERIKDM